MFIHNSNLNKIIMLGAFIFVSGCDNTNQLDTNSVDEFARISAQNAIYSTEYSDSYEVDLSNNVTFSGSDGFSVSSVEALSTSPECQVQSTTQTGFTISANISKACDYKYEVVLSDNQQVSQSDDDVSIARMAEPLSDSAITRIAVSRMAAEEGSVELSAISATTLIEQSVVVNVSQELLLQTGYALSPDFALSTDLTLPYSSASATADPVTNTIDYTPPAGFEGIERILYSYIDEVTGDVLLGALDIAVAYQANQGLVVQDEIYHAPVPLNSLETIDVSDYVESVDGDDFQLVYVNAYHAATELTDINDVTNKSFTFLTSEMKYHYVSFAVTDHKGAYATGMMQVPAYDDSNVGQWDNIVYNNLSYFRPLTTTETMNNDIDRAGYIEDTSYTPPVTLSLYTWGQAEACSRVGRIPTVGEMQALQDNTNIRVTYNWPTTTLYWADDGGIAKTIDMTTGEVATPIGTEYLITCIIVTGVTAEVVKTDAVANMTDSAEIKFNYTEQAGNTAEVVVVENELITITTDSATAQTAATMFTDADGNAVVHVTNTKAEEVEVCGEVGTSTSCVKVRFIADVETAQVTRARLDVSEWQPNDYGTYVLETEVLDAYGNPVGAALTNNEITRDDNTASLEVTQNTTLTNADGLAKTNVINTDSAEVDITTIKVTHVNGAGEESNVIIHSTWGQWQWSDPVDVRIIKNDYFLGTNDRYGCSPLDASWRGLFNSEITEYNEAVNAMEPGSNPLTNAIEEYWDTTGDYILTHKGPQFWMAVAGTTNTTIALLLGGGQYVDKNYYFAYDWLDSSATKKLSKFGDEYVGFTRRDLATICVRDL